MKNQKRRQSVSLQSWDFNLKCSQGEDGSGTDDDSDEDRTEKDDYTIRKRWAGLEKRKKWTPREQGINAAVRPTVNYEGLSFI